MSNVLRFIGVTKDALTAGPGKRLELFTKGCIRGVVSPCEGCFNQITWSFEGKYKEYTIDDLVNMIDRDAWNRQVTFCGGEPILQARAITQVAKRLKEIDSSFHFVMYTMYKLDVLMKHGLQFTWRKERHEPAMVEQLKDYSASYDIKKTDENDNPLIVKFQILTPSDVHELMEYIDMIVDGEYQHDKRLTTHPTMHDGGFIGSANQRVFNCKETIKEVKRQQKIDSFSLKFAYADEYMDWFNQHHHCKTCGHVIATEKDYCNAVCENRFVFRRTQAI